MRSMLTSFKCNLLHNTYINFMLTAAIKSFFNAKGIILNSVDYIISTISFC